eukprot:CAMPEP_0201497946 /NCGR_PEP_ID=MMETSP0151_2-20130828/68526_1 /ASSEMBLY_ACC=CAM_ASM_000257 /TAXON_ID=200890 /ORGANISM="Paramoeba atlantica, Strain 621/1 / CCAP 1560/9" /LENGTH=317 /DNA_ID=CAMNT_0047889133 /DNA_START=90 /DNA_END=1043 /DNA_ORIENTATION=-
MKEYLAENGFAVVASVATKKDIERGKDLFWNFVQHINENDEKFSAKRGDPSTWETFLGNPRNGIMSTHCVGQSDFVWHGRLLPKVKEAFATIWDTDELLVSFDGANAFRPWKYNPDWLTKGGWWHIDQNCYERPHRTGMCCVQGVLTYYDVDESTGGLCVMKGSHNEHSRLCESSPSRSMRADFIPLQSFDPLFNTPKKRLLVKAKAGDLLLWDSRTVHCNTPALEKKDEILEEEKEKHKDLIRLVSYICMMPTSKASKEVLEARWELFFQGIGTSHWPDDIAISCLGNPKYHTPTDIEFMSEAHKRLICPYDPPID